MIDAIYELYTGDYIDLSNLVTVSKVYLDKFPAYDIEDKRGQCYFSCRFRFIKDEVRFHDDKIVNGDVEAEERKKEIRRTTTFKNGSRMDVI